MIVTSNLIQYPNGFNNVFTGCCDSEVELFLELEPGGADHEISDIYLYSGISSTLEITEVGGIAYTTTPGSSINVTLTQTFVVTQGNQLSIKFKYCPGIGVGSIEQIQLTTQCTNHGGYDNYFFAITGIDIDPAYLSIIAETSAVYTSCSTDCDVKKDLLHFNNPSSFNLPVTTTLSTTCGFNFFIDGNPIDITDFQLPPGQSIIQINNQGCIVPVACNFDILFDFCGKTLNIPITHEVVLCGTCGIDCRGISINTNPISMPKIGIAEKYYLNVGIENWYINGTYVYDSNYPGFIRSVFSQNGSTIMNLGPILSVNSIPFTYSPTFNTGDHVTLYWEIETKTITITDLEIQYDGTLTGGTPIVLVPSGSVFPNTKYSGSIDIPSFLDPATLNNVGYYIITGTITDYINDAVEFNPLEFRLQQYQKPNLLSQVDLDCSTLNDYNVTAVGDSKTITFQYYYHNGFADFTQVWFNPWAFDSTANYSTIFGGTIQQPNSGFVVDVMSSWIAGGVQEMSFIGSNSQKNYKAYINILNSNEFEIILDFFLVQDMLDWVNTFDVDNQRKLLYTSADPATPILSNTVNSVYLNTKAFGFLLYITDINYPVSVTNTIPPKIIPYECYLESKVMFDVRWWNQGLNAGLSEMSNPSFSLTRNTNPVTVLSTINPTLVTFDVYYSGTIDNVVFWLFDTTGTDNTIDFYDNYDSSRSVIPTIPTAGVINNHLESPSTAVTALGGGHYQVTATISKNINPNGLYRIGAICYSYADDIVNSFLSDELTVTTSADISDICCPLDVDVHWLDYVHDHNDSCFMPTLKERIKNDMYITGGSFNTCLQTLGMPSGTNWLDYLVSVVLTVYQKRDTYPTINDRSYFYYGTYNSDKDPLTGIWDNPFSELFVSDDGTTLYTSWAGRVLWNDTKMPGYKVFVGPMDQYYNRTQLSNAVGNSYVNFHNVTYNWANQDIYFEYNFIFNVESFIPGCRGVYLAQINQLHPMNYADTLTTYDKILDTIDVVGWQNGVPTTLGTSFCSENYDYIEVTVTQEAGYTDGKLIATLNYAPFTEFSIAENESFTSTNFAQSEDAPMYDVDADFVAGVATFKIDTSALTPGNYQICAIRIPN